MEADAGAGAGAKKPGTCFFCAPVKVHSNFM